MDDRRRFAPATERNREPLLEVLQQWLPHSGNVLEIASGTGEHAMFFAKHFPTLEFQPSDCVPEALDSIEAWRKWSPLPNVRSPLLLDVQDARSWGPPMDAIVCINMLHIAPWACTAALFRGAAGHLKKDGSVITYGPYRRGGAHTAPSNAAFDQALQDQNPLWGVRDLEDVEATASAAGFLLSETVEMPANNLALRFQWQTSIEGNGRQ